jgi:molybdate transport system regulatory protein
MALSARNRLAGTVTNVERGDTITEVAVELDGGETVTATITTASADRLGVEEGAAVDAVVKASSVMLES